MSYRSLNRLFAGFSLVIVAAVLTFLWVTPGRVERCDRVGISWILKGESKDFVNEAGIDYLLETFDPEDKLELRGIPILRGLLKGEKSCTRGSVSAGDI